MFMVRSVFVVQSLETGHFLSALDGEPYFTFDLTKAYQFRTENDAISHARTFGDDIQHISVISLYIPIGDTIKSLKTYIFPSKSNSKK